MERGGMKPNYEVVVVTPSTDTHSYEGNAVAAAVVGAIGVVGGIFSVRFGMDAFNSISERRYGQAAFEVGVATGSAFFGILAGYGARGAARDIGRRREIRTGIGKRRSAIPSEASPQTSASSSSDPEVPVWDRPGFFDTMDKPSE